jgi:hypothetical protein
MSRRVSSVTLVMGLTLLGATLGTAQATQRGGGSSPDAILYELTEHTVLTEDGFRIATASLEGSARRGSALCPDGLQAYARAVFAMAGVRVKVEPQCTVVAVGTSQIDLKSVPFAGEISGDFWLVVNSDATNLTDAQELVIMNGTFQGKVEVNDTEGRTIAILPGSTFTPTAVLPGFPLPPAASFTGTFRIPFKAHHVAVYENDRGRPVPVRPDERALGDPTVRLEVEFD